MQHAWFKEEEMYCILRNQNINIIYSLHTFFKMKNRCHNMNNHVLEASQLFKSKDKNLYNLDVFETRFLINNLISVYENIDYIDWNIHKH